MVFFVEKFWSSDEPMGLFEATTATLIDSAASGVSSDVFPDLCREVAATSLALVSIDHSRLTDIWENAGDSNFESIGLERDIALQSVAAAMIKINRDLDARALQEAATSRGEQALFAGYPENFRFLRGREEIADALGKLLKQEIQFVRLGREELEARWVELAKNA